MRISGKRNQYAHQLLLKTKHLNERDGLNVAAKRLQCLPIEEISYQYLNLDQ